MDENNDGILIRDELLVEFFVWNFI
jgi:hypothetical protein